MDRLTKRNEENTAYYYPKCFEKCDGLGASEKCNNCDLVHDACEKLGEYEDLEEQGLLLKLPCKVGDTVYSLDRFCGGYLLDCSLRPCEKCSDYQLEIYEGKFAMKDISDFGKTVFLTREQAEEALKKMRGTE